MPVSATNIVVYGSNLMPEDDTTINIGGGPDLTTLIVFTDLVIPGTVEMLSTMTDTLPVMTITGRTVSGAVVSEAHALFGMSVVSFSATFERIMKFELNIQAAGTVTVRKAGNTGNLAVFPAGITTVRPPFYLASSDIIGGDSRTFHEKIFIRNEHQTLDLTDAEIIEQADPGANITFALETVLDGTGTNGAFNRLTAPAGLTFNSNPKPVANNKNHTAGTSQGVWLKLTLPAGTAPAKNTYTIREKGKTI